jgi:hypothetical protein
LKWHYSTNIFSIKRLIEMVQSPLNEGVINKKEKKDCREFSIVYNHMHETVNLDTPHKKPEISQSKQQPISILLMGVDERSGDRGRSDTLIAMTLNPKKGNMQM